MLTVGAEAGGGVGGSVGGGGVTVWTDTDGHGNMSRLENYRLHFYLLCDQLISYHPSAPYCQPVGVTCRRVAFVWLVHIMEQVFLTVFKRRL